MIEFQKDYIDQFLGVVRKYMQLRGGLSQKDLAEKIDIGISTLSRFLNQKTKEVDEQIVARIVAFLSIPLHEIIEFVAEADTETFKKLVGVFKEEVSRQAKLAQMPKVQFGDEDYSETRTSSGINVRPDPTRSGVFHEVMSDSRLKQLEDFRERVGKLTPRQRAYLTDFLDLESEAKEMVVEVGEVVIRYFKGRKVSF